jgi:flagellar biosynthesis protein FlhA
MPPSAPAISKAQASANPLQTLGAFVAKHRGLVVPLAFVMLVVVIVIPLPPAILDVLIAMNIALSVIILMTTMYMEEPLDFSVFPSLLLGVTLFRLVLNVASTRLILSADASSPEEALTVAGHVIATFGSFVAGGSLIVGVILFLILVIIQFVVITKGATRISEVAARFTLDAMPGKQMAIDADLNAGIISEQEARTRRERIGQEADFFGAMDGASKFVRGDAIAGLIITVVNVLGGFVIGWLVKGWEPGKTAEIFTILTIGDGLSSQIPAFIVSIAAALVVTRSGSKQDLGTQITGQLGSNSTALYVTAGFLGLLALTPMPTLPMLGLGSAIGYAGWAMSRKRARAAADKARAEATAAAAAPAEAPAAEELLKVDTMELEVGYGLVPLVDTKQGGQLLDRITAIRRQLAAEIGLVMPPVRIRDNMQLQPSAYRVKIRGSPIADGETRPGMLLAMDSGITTGAVRGIQTKEPAFGLDAWWIEPSLGPRAQSLNYTVVDPTSVLTTHLGELVRAHADELLTREEVNNLIIQLKQRSPKLIEETVPKIVSPGDLQKVLQALLRERVPIRDLETIIETLADWAPKTKDVDVLTEYVRNALRRTICQQHAVPNDPARQSTGRRAAQRIVCVTLDPAFEDVISGYIDRSPAGTSLSMPAGVANSVARRIADALKPVIAAGHQPVVIASPQVRAQVRQILEPHLPTCAVLGYNEIVAGVEVESLGLVTAPTNDRTTAGAAA